MKLRRGGKNTQKNWGRKKIGLSDPDNQDETSLVAQTVKCVPTMQETQIWSLGWEDPPGEGNGNPLQYSCLENPMDGEAW